MKLTSSPGHWSYSPLSTNQHSVHSNGDSDNMATSPPSPPSHYSLASQSLPLFTENFSMWIISAPRSFHHPGDVSVPGEICWSPYLLPSLSNPVFHHTAKGILEKHKPIISPVCNPSMASQSPIFLTQFTTTFKTQPLLTWASWLLPLPRLCCAPS